MPTIKFKKEKDKTKKEIEVPAGMNLRAAMQSNQVEVYEGIHKKLNCGGKGTCGTCRVHIVKGAENASPPGFIERMRIKFSWFAIGHEDEVRLSCQAQVNGDMTVNERAETNLYGIQRRTPSVRAGYFE
jgi:ferredoxin